jgi:hypothetical protein
MKIEFQIYGNEVVAFSLAIFIQYYNMCSRAHICHIDNNEVKCCNTLSSSAIIKIIFGNVEFSRNYLFEMSKFKKIAMKGKLQKDIGGKQGTLASSQSTCKERCAEAGPCTMVTSILFLSPSFLAHNGNCLH